MPWTAKQKRLFFALAKRGELRGGMKKARAMSREPTRRTVRHQGRRTRR
jgi:hypothetical protein